MTDLTKAEKDDYWGITCQCGHFDTYDAFEVDITDITSRHYQCPECGNGGVAESRILADGSDFCYVRPVETIEVVCD